VCNQVVLPLFYNNSILYGEVVKKRDDSSSSATMYKMTSLYKLLLLFKKISIPTPLFTANFFNIFISSHSFSVLGF